MAGSDSIWKKEIRFSWKRKEELSEPLRTATAPAVQPTSIWKKEISLGRKGKSERPAKTQAPVAAGDKTSIWKKEISLGRKPKNTGRPRVDQPLRPVGSLARPATPEPGPEVPMPPVSSHFEQLVPFVPEPAV